MTTTRSHVGRQVARGSTDPDNKPWPFPSGRPADPRPQWLISDEAMTRAAYVQGWRAAIGHGLVAGLLLGAVVVSAALQLGRMLG